MTVKELVKICNSFGLDILKNKMYAPVLPYDRGFYLNYVLIDFFDTKINLIKYHTRENIAFHLDRNDIPYDDRDISISEGSLKNFLSNEIEGIKKHLTQLKLKKLEGDFQ